MFTLGRDVMILMKVIIIYAFVKAGLVLEKAFTQLSEENQIVMLLVILC